MTFGMIAGSEGLFSLVSMTSQYLLADIDSEVTGEIIDSENRWISSYRGGGRESYNIRYIYFVDDEAYIGDVVSYEIYTELVGERMDSYQVGQYVIVRYDSSFPRWSILENGEMSTRMKIQAFLTFVIWPLFMYGLGKVIFDD